MARQERVHHLLVLVLELGERLQQPQQHLRYLVDLWRRLQWHQCLNWTDWKTCFLMVILWMISTKRINITAWFAKFPFRSIVIVILFHSVRQLTNYAYCLLICAHWLVIEFHVSIICCLATIRENKNLERGGGGGSGMNLDLVLHANHFLHPSHF